MKEKTILFSNFEGKISANITPILYALGKETSNICCPWWNFFTNCNIPSSICHKGKVKNKKKNMFDFLSYIPARPPRSCCSWTGAAPWMGTWRVSRPYGTWCAVGRRRRWNSRGPRGMTLCPRSSLRKEIKFWIYQGKRGIFLVTFLNGGRAVSSGGINFAQVLFCGSKSWKRRVFCMKEERAGFSRGEKWPLKF